MLWYMLLLFIILNLNLFLLLRSCLFLFRCFGAKFTRTLNLDFFLWSVLSIGVGVFHGFDNLLTLFNFTKHDMLTIEPRSLGESNKELRTIGVATRVCHGQKEWLGVSYFEVFITKLGSINTFSASSIELSEITTLSHESRNNSMEDTLTVVKHLSANTSASFTSAKLSEILCSSWSNILEELHDNGALFNTANANIKEYTRILWA
mmetsp:Transcript_91006/g.125476  ORF Transcript_91006/g.125476 Transcript_91006/m.125476 type:complete len:206 (-) Transcript_91006:17-634(-)